MNRALPLFALVFVACSSSPDEGAVDAGPVDTGIVPNVCPSTMGAEAVSFTTDDGVTIAGDLYTTGMGHGAAVVLVHMIPPANDRTNFPIEFIEELQSRGFSVLNIDRRGAGESTGSAEDAYMGPKSALDVKAAYSFLVGHACAYDSTRISYVGASNGTTSILDFSVLAETDPEIELPRSMVFLTGGSYTEGQNTIEGHRQMLMPLPMLFIFSTAERSWSAGFMSDAPRTWNFREFQGGDHGTKMFQAKPESIELVANFLRAKAG